LIILECFLPSLLVAFVGTRVITTE
jgi:hypothetical protein